jgi:hypothetical protein
LGTSDKRLWCYFLYPDTRNGKKAAATRRVNCGISVVGIEVKVAFSGVWKSLSEISGGSEILSGYVVYSMSTLSLILAMLFNIQTSAYLFS